METEGSSTDSTLRQRRLLMQQAVQRDLDVHLDQVWTRGTIGNYFRSGQEDHDGPDDPEYLGKQIIWQINSLRRPLEALEFVTDKDSKSEFSARRMEQVLQHQQNTDVLFYQI